MPKRTEIVGEKILLDHGARLEGDKLIIPAQQPKTSDPEIFTLSDLTRWWNPDWKLERAGFGGAGGGLAGIRGDTYLDGDTLAIWPRDEIRGALLRRSVDLGDAPSLTFDAGADAGRTWHLLVFVNNEKVLDRLIDGDSPLKENASERHWEPIRIDLAAYSNHSVEIRLYDLILVPNRYVGNSYWRNLNLSGIQRK